MLLFLSVKTWSSLFSWWLDKFDPLFSGLHVWNEANYDNINTITVLYYVCKYCVLRIQLNLANIVLISQHFTSMFDWILQWNANLTLAKFELITVCSSAQTISKHHRLHCFCREMSNAWRMMNAPYWSLQYPYCRGKAPKRCSGIMLYHFIAFELNNISND